MTNITPEEKEKIDQAKMIADANPDGKGNENDGEDFEKRFKDTQSAFTKAQQEKVEMAKMLVESDPANVERIPDEKVRTKVLQEKWGVDSIEELNALFPNYKNKPNDDSGEEDETTEIEKLKQTVKLMQYQGTKSKTKEAIENLMKSNSEIIATIPDFEGKIKEKMKFISESVSPKERVDMAYNLVISSNISSGGNAYGAMQGVVGFSASKAEEPNEKPITSSLIKDIMSKRRM